MTRSRRALVAPVAVAAAVLSSWLVAGSVRAQSGAAPSQEAPGAPGAGAQDPSAAPAAPAASPAPADPNAPAVVVPGPAPVPPLPPRDPGERSPAPRPVLSMGTDLFFVKPILVIAGGVQIEQVLKHPNENKESRNVTPAITRFGFEGRLGRYVSFRSEFERNIMLHGSGIWEGTAAFSVRDQFLRLQNWGLTLDAGIVLDEASVDFFSAHTADLLLADKYTRNPLLYSGFNRGQGVHATYARWGFKLGFSYTDANPLSTSTSFQIGGAFAGGSRLWEKPLGNFRIGQPDDDFHLRVLSPSLTWENAWVEAKAAVQLFNVNYQTASKADPNLGGYNLRGNVRVKVPFTIRVPFLVSPFFNYARITNDVLNNTSGYSDKLLATSYVGQTIGGGIDIFVNGRSGIGANYVVVTDDSPSFIAPTGEKPASEPLLHTRQTFFNVGGTWWITDQVALGARGAWYHKTQKDNENKDKPETEERDRSFFVTLRLVI